MNVTDIVFILTAIVTVGSAVVVVVSRSLIYSVFSLLFTFFGVAVLYVFLGADSWPVPRCSSTWEGSWFCCCLA